MSKQSQHVLIALPHPLLHLVSLGLVSFIFTLFSLELSQFGTQLAPLWFPTSIMMVAFYRHAGRMWPGIALSCSLGNIAASILLFSTSSLNMTWTTINIVEAVVGAVLLRALQYYAVKYSGRQQYWFGSGDSGRHRIAQNAAPAELQRLP